MIFEIFSVFFKIMLDKFILIEYNNNCQGDTDKSNLKEIKKMAKWYAVQDRDDYEMGEHGIGSFDRAEAEAMARKTAKETGWACLAEIDTEDDFCLSEEIFES